MVYYIVNISLHISVDISLMLNITLKFLCIEVTGQWKSLQIIKKKNLPVLKKPSSISLLLLSSLFTSN